MPFLFKPAEPMAEPSVDELSAKLAQGYMLSKDELGGLRQAASATRASESRYRFRYRLTAPCKTKSTSRSTTSATERSGRVCHLRFFRALGLGRWNGMRILLESCRLCRSLL